MIQERKCTYNVILRNLCLTIFCRGKAVSIKRYGSVLFALFTQHAKRILRARFSCVTRLALQYFSTLSHKKGKIFGKKRY